MACPHQIAAVCNLRDKYRIDGWSQQPPSGSTINKAQKTQGLEEKSA